MPLISITEIVSFFHDEFIPAVQNCTPAILPPDGDGPRVRWHAVRLQVLHSVYIKRDRVERNRA